MQKNFKLLWWGSVLSGLLTFFAVCHINFVFSWVCYVPLFLSVCEKPAKQTFKAALLFGITFSCLAFFWMIPGAERFTGKSVMYGAGVFVISAAFFSLYIALVMYCFAFLKKSIEHSGSILLNGFLIASVFCVAEALLMIVSSGFPWFDVHSGNGLAENKFAIQPAAFFGIHIMSFVAIMVNYLFAVFIFKKLWQKLFIPVTIVVAYLLAGFFILQNFENKLPESKKISIAILSENFLPDIPWDDNTGNMLVQKLLDLNREAVSLKPNIALWSESAIPWTYRKDDDLVKEINKITEPAHITHILGINTAYRENEVFNSAYCILPEGDVAGRYDKQYLLSLIEKPMNGWVMPFFSNKGFYARNDAAHAAPLNTPHGKAGVLICNEAAVPAAAANQVKQGAEFLFNMSNDGWFNDTYIVNLHFYYARLRAVETRKDVAVNCNNGYSGLIQASGQIADQEKSDVPFVKMVMAQPNNYKSLYTTFPHIFIYACALYIAFIIALKLIRKNPEDKETKKVLIKSNL